jgi:hypothetical protein
LEIQLIKNCFINIKCLRILPLFLVKVKINYVFAMFLHYFRCYFFVHLYLHYLFLLIKLEPPTKIDDESEQF